MELGAYATCRKCGDEVPATDMGKTLCLQCVEELAPKTVWTGEGSNECPQCGGGITYDDCLDPCTCNFSHEQRLQVLATSADAPETGQSDQTGGEKK